MLRIDRINRPAPTHDAEHLFRGLRPFHDLRDSKKAGHRRPAFAISRAGYSPSAVAPALITSLPSTTWTSTMPLPPASSTIASDGRCSSVAMYCAVADLPV